MERGEKRGRNDGDEREGGREKREKSTVSSVDYLWVSREGGREEEKEGERYWKRRKLRRGHGYCESYIDFEFEFEVSETPGNAEGRERGGGGGGRGRGRGRDDILWQNFPKPV